MKAGRWPALVLYWLGHALATGLAVLVALAPLVDSHEAADGWRRILSLFAHDVVLRRTTLASALGLVVTARIFFRPGGPDGLSTRGEAGTDALPAGGRHVRCDL
jgi:hypothetical protein